MSGASSGECGWNHGAPRPTGRGAYHFEGRGKVEPFDRAQDRKGRRADGPGMRLMRLWLWSAPLAMLALAVLFAVLAVGEARWGLLAAMVLLALVAGGLFVVQWRLLRRLGQR